MTCRRSAAVVAAYVPTVVRSQLVTSATWVAQVDSGRQDRSCKSCALSAVSEAEELVAVVDDCCESPVVVDMT